MNKRQLGLVALISSLFIVTVMAGSLLFFSRVSAAPPATTNPSKVAQTPAGGLPAAAPSCRKAGTTRP